MEDLIEITGNSVKDLRDNLNELTYGANGIHFEHILWQTYRVTRRQAQSIANNGKLFTYSVLVVIDPHLSKHKKGKTNSLNGTSIG